MIALGGVMVGSRDGRCAGITWAMVLCFDPEYSFLHVVMKGLPKGCRTGR